MMALYCRDFDPRSIDIAISIYNTLCSDMIIDNALLLVMVIDID